MRLIDISKYPTIQFRDVADPRTACYAILSHVWNKPGDDDFVPEPTYRDLSFIITPSGSLPPDNPVYSKLCRFCDVAFSQGYTLIWADMCCIDKTSSAELSEAIASMYHWYRCADVCYAYLKDVSSSANRGRDRELAVLDSGWFRRGWTLQELIAPRSLAFFDKDWTALGTKSSLANHIMSITHIHPDVLTHRQSVHDVSVAQRMSWAAGRETTRPEDQSYCLMGLFGIRIPVMYGEGTYAFVRLQEEILRSIPDPSLLAWGKRSDDLSSLGYDMRVDSLLSPTSVQDSVHILPPPSSIHVDRYLLAASPDDFVLGGYGNLSIRPVEKQPSTPPRPFPFQIVPCHILRMRAHIVPLYAARSPISAQKQSSASPEAFLAMLECKTHTGKSLALLLSIGHSDSGQPFWYVGNQTTSSESGDSRDLSVTRIVTLGPGETPEVDSRMVRDVYVPVSAPRSVGGSAHIATIHRALCQNTGGFRIKVPGWCPVTLAASQYFLTASPTDTHARLLTLPPGYETCPHNPSDSGRCEAAAASPSGRCPDSSGILRITFANCQSSACGTYWKDSKARYLWGDIQVDAAPSRSSAQIQNATPACEGVHTHIASWTLRDGVASKAFTFRIRKMQDDAPAGSATGSTEDGHALLHPVRTHTIQVTLALKRMPSERLEDPHTFLLEVDVSKLPPQGAATPAPSPTRNQGLDLNLLIPDPASLAADRQRQSPLAARRRNSIVTLSRTTSAAGDPEPFPASAPQRRVRSTSLSREPSAAPSIPSGSAAVPIIVTPAPIARLTDIETSFPAPPASRVRPSPPAVPSLPPLDLPSFFLPPPPPSPSPPSPIHYTASAPAHAGRPSTRLAHAVPQENGADVTEPEPARAPHTRVSEGRGAAASKGSRNRADDTPHSTTSPARMRVAKAAMTRIRRIMSKLGRSRPESPGNVEARVAGASATSA